MKFDNDLQDLLLAYLSAILIGWLRPYQRKWLMDRSLAKVGVMSRQIGKSEVISLEATLQALEKPKTPEKVVLLVSSGGFQAMELLRKVLRWTDLLDAAMKKVFGPDATIYLKTPNTECIQLINGVRIVSHPANPRTLAGFTGDVFWDEAGRTAQDYLIMEAIGPITDEGPYRLRLTGTPWGDTGVLYDICCGGKGGGPKPGWSYHRVTIVEAIAQGLHRDLEFIKSRYDPFTFAQDYMCEFNSSASQVFGRELLLDAMRLELPAPKWDDRNIRRALGVDIGRTHDKTAQVWMADYPDGYYQTERVQLLRKLPFNEQEAIIAADLAGGRISKARIDSTGIGAHMAENLTIRFPGIAEAVPFTPKLKEDLVSLELALLQSRRIKLTADSDLISDFSAIRQEYLPRGTIRYDASRDERGHADSFWAHGLALSGLVGVTDWRIDFINDAPPERQAVVPIQLDGTEALERQTPPGMSIMSALQAYQSPRADAAHELPVYGAGDLEAELAADDDMMVW